MTPRSSVGVSQGGEIARDVGGAAGHEALALEIHDRHRRFRRNAGHRAPDELVEHDVAQHDEPGLARAAQESADTGGA